MSGRGVGKTLLALSFLGSTVSCAHAPAPAPHFDPATGPRAFGFTFGSGAHAVTKQLAAQKVTLEPFEGDDDALVADRCPGAPLDGPCRLDFGLDGLYAAAFSGAGADSSAALSALAAVFGPPSRRGGDEGDIAAWELGEWTVMLASFSEGGQASLIAHVEYDPVAPPVVAGIRLGRRRASSERGLEESGLKVLEREADATVYRLCPSGAKDADACRVDYRDGRVASVTEVLGSFPEPARALESWRARAQALQKEIGVAPAESCPPAGPAADDCVASWQGDRLAVVVGAHKNAAGPRAGQTTVYTLWAYPRLFAPPSPAPGTPAKD